LENSKFSTFFRLENKKKIRILFLRMIRESGPLVLKPESKTAIVSGGWKNVLIM